MNNHRGLVASEGTRRRKSPMEGEIEYSAMGELEGK